MRCPTCKKEFDSKQSPAHPFCSDRCRQIDLGRWLSEEQRLPAGSLDEEGDPADRRREAGSDDDDPQHENSHD